MQDETKINSSNLKIILILPFSLKTNIITVLFLSKLPL